MFEGDVEAFEVFADDDEVDIFVAAAGDHRAGGAKVGVEVEFLAQADVDGAEAAADGGCERAFEGEAGAADAGKGCFGQRISAGGDRGHAAELDVPREGAAEGFEDIDGGLDDFGADAVTRDEGGGDLGSGFARHGGLLAARGVVRCGMARLGVGYQSLPFLEDVNDLVDHRF